MTCYLIRHGKDDETIRGGWSNAPLTDDGIKQAECMAEKLATSSIKQIFSSDLLRATQTADILAQRLGLPVTLLPAFRETNNGALAGMKNELAKEVYPGLYWSALGWDEHYPDGESPHEFLDRISHAWQCFKQQTKNIEFDIALITHAGVINVIQCIEHDIAYTNKSVSFPIANAEWVTVDY